MLKVVVTVAGVVVAIVLLLAELTDLTAPSLALNPELEVRDSSVEPILPVITHNSNCEDWAAWIPPRPDPAVVLQVGAFPVVY